MTSNLGSDIIQESNRTNNYEQDEKAWWWGK